MSAVHLLDLSHEAVKIKQCLFPLMYPKSALRFDKPDAGLPILEDWLTIFESIFFAGVELQREPLDCTMNGSDGARVSKVYSVSLKHVSTDLHLNNET